MPCLRATSNNPELITCPNETASVSSPCGMWALMPPSRICDWSRLIRASKTQMTPPSLLASYLNFLPIISDKHSIMLPQNAKQMTKIWNLNDIILLHTSNYFCNVTAFFWQLKCFLNGNFHFLQISWKSYFSYDIHLQAGKSKELPCGYEKFCENNRNQALEALCRRQKRGEIARKHRLPASK